MNDPDSLEGIPAPEVRQESLGHEEARDAVAAQLQAGRLPGTIMLHGPQGIGKATLAFELAALILTTTGDEATGRVQEQVAALSHPNLAVLRRRPKDSKSFYSVIRVEDVRELRESLHRTRGRVGHRIAIIDSIDDCNGPSANALLKTLEEPPSDTTFFLVSHRPGGLLPTIKSRCHVLALRPISIRQVAEVVTVTTPNVSPALLERAGDLAKGRPRRAFEMLALGEESPVGVLIEWLKHPGMHPIAAEIALADQLGKDPQSADMSFARELLSDWIAAEMRQAALEQGGRARLASATDLWDKVHALFEEADSVNLDMKQTLIVIFDSIRAHCALSAVPEPL